MGKETVKWVGGAGLLDGEVFVLTLIRKGG